MLLQKGVPLKAAHGWKRVACIPPPMAVSQSLPVVLDLVSLSLSRGGRDLSPLGGVSCRNKSIPVHLFSTLMLVEVGRGQICFMMNVMTFLSLLPSPLQEPLCPAWQSTPFQPVIHLSQAWPQQPAACPLLLHGQLDQGRSHSSLLRGSCCQLFPARAGRCQSTRGISEGPQGLAGI